MATAAQIDLYLTEMETKQHNPDFNKKYPNHHRSTHYSYKLFQLVLPTYYLNQDL